MNQQQNKIADKALEELNEIRSQIANRVGDADELTKRYNDIVLEVKAGLHDIINNAKKAPEEYWKENNTINISEFPACGSIQRQPKHNAGDKLVGAGVVDAIRNEIKENPLDYAELQEITADAAPGSGAGNELRRIKVKDIGQPKWIAEMQSQLKLFKQRSKTKGFYDPEGLARGMVWKQKEKKVMRSKTLWIALDTSGSMLSTQSKGESVLELVASYIVPIAREFQGELWQVDVGVPTEIYKLKELKESTVRGIPVKGGGGTEFDEVFRLLNKKKAEFKEQLGPQTEFMTIFLTDAIVDWDVNLLPDNFLIITLAQTESHLPPLDESRNQKAILIEVD